MCWKWDGQRWEIITLKQWCQHLLCTEVGYDYQNHHKGIFVHKIVCGLKPQFTIIQYFLWLFSFKWYHVLVKIVTGWSGDWSREGTKHGLNYSILISNFLHFDDRKSLSQFRQKMNVYGLVRPSPDPQDEPELTNRRRASENLDQWEARTRDHAPVSAGRGEGLFCPG